MMCGVLHVKRNCSHWLDSSFGILKDWDLITVLYVKCTRVFPNDVPYEEKLIPGYDEQ